MTRFYVKSAALGDEAVVEVNVYKSRKAMKKAAKKFYDYKPSRGVEGLCQTYDIDGTIYPIVRLHRKNLRSMVVSHELHHAATAIYGNHLTPGRKVKKVLHHANEPFAYLYSDLFSMTVDLLHAHGYYQEDK